MSVKIEVSFHGIDDKCDMWINHMSGECDGVDDRVLDFLRSVYERGMFKFRKEMDKYEAGANKEAREKDERQELARLEKKYRC